MAVHPSRPRQRGVPTLKPNPEPKTQDAERQINCVAVHPSRPHLAASGASAGSVAVWDLRFAARPAHATLPGDAGEVWEVRAQSQELRRRDRWSGHTAYGPAVLQTSQAPWELNVQGKKLALPVSVGCSRPGKQPPLPAYG